MSSPTWPVFFLVSVLSFVCCLRYIWWQWQWWHSSSSLLAIEMASQQYLINRTANNSDQITIKNHKHNTYVHWHKIYEYIQIYCCMYKNMNYTRKDPIKPLFTGDHKFLLYTVGATRWLFKSSDRFTSPYLGMNICM